MAEISTKYLQVDHNYGQRDGASGVADKDAEEAALERE